jgi:hypothetical protein
MSVCPVCNQQLSENTVLCPQHTGGPVSGWAAGNRIMCDFFHRGIPPPRLNVVDRVDDFARHSAEAA